MATNGASNGYDNTPEDLPEDDEDQADGTQDAKGSKVPQPKFTPASS